MVLSDYYIFHPDNSKLYKPSPLPTITSNQPSIIYLNSRELLLTSRSASSVDRKMMVAYTATSFCLLSTFRIVYAKAMMLMIQDIATTITYATSVWLAICRL